MSSTEGVASKRHFYADEPENGEETLDQTITADEKRRGQLLSRLRDSDNDQPVDAQVAAEVVSHMTIRGAFVRDAFGLGVGELLAGAGAFFANEKSANRSTNQQLAARDARERFAHRFARDGCVVVGLTTKPPSIAEPKVSAQPQISVCRDRPLACHDVPDSLRGHTNVLGQTVLGQAQRFQELFIQHFAGRHRGDGAHVLAPSVVVDDLNVLRVFGGPNETHSPLIVDANAVLPPANSLQCLQLIAGWDAQIVKDRRPVELLKLAQGWPLDVDPSADSLTEKQCLGVFALEALDRHSVLLT